jgi:hypothetical protein
MIERSRKIEKEINLEEKVETEIGIETGIETGRGRGIEGGVTGILGREADTGRGKTGIETAEKGENEVAIEV